MRGRRCGGGLTARKQDGLGEVKAAWENIKWNCGEINWFRGKEIVSSSFCLRGNIQRGEKRIMGKRVGAGGEIVVRVIKSV